MRLDDIFRWAPLTCFIPVITPELSEARDGTPHARKLYALYAKDAESYGAKPTSTWHEEQNPTPASLQKLEQVYRHVGKCKVSSLLTCG